jgi:Phosphotyrosyl phosphate activator (PTPA) protein
VAVFADHCPCLTRPMHCRQLQVLDTLSAWVDAIPPVTQSLRYGNPAFRTWCAWSSLWRRLHLVAVYDIGTVPRDRCASQRGG